MRQTSRFFVAALALALAGCVGAQSQSSPAATADVTLKGQTISIQYSRPSMRGRKIMGGLVPYGQVWRTGANEATQLSTPVDLTIGGANVPAGLYTLYSLVGEHNWKLIVNKQTGQSGTEYHQDQDLVRVDMHMGKTPAPVEQFTISWHKTGDAAADLVFEWETTRLTVPVKVK
jgi:Protein of unknown function (DUF2911)